MIRHSAEWARGQGTCARGGQWGKSFFATATVYSLLGAGLSSYAVGHRFTRELQVTGLLLRVKFTTDAMLHPVSRNGSHTLRSLLLVG